MRAVVPLRDGVVLLQPCILTHVMDQIRHLHKIPDKCRNEDCGGVGARTKAMGLILVDLISVSSCFG